MNAASGSTANTEGVTLVGKSFQVMDLKFRITTPYMSSVDQTHKSTTGGSFTTAGKNVLALSIKA